MGCWAGHRNGHRVRDFHGDTGEGWGLWGRDQSASKMQGVQGSRGAHGVVLCRGRFLREGAGKQGNTLRRGGCAKGTANGSIPVSIPMEPQYPSQGYPSIHWDQRERCGCRGVWVGTRARREEAQPMDDGLKEDQSAGAGKKDPSKGPTGFLVRRSSPSDAALLLLVLSTSSQLGARLADKD